MKKILFIFLLLSPAFIFAQNNTNKPTLIVGIVVEQMRYDILSKYWNKFSNSGFKKLINNGTFYKNAHYNYLNINSASGYATISTGSYPSQHGIINETWYDRIKLRDLYCTEDANVHSVGTNYENGKSPQNISSTAWTDELRLSNFKMSKIYSIGIKDYAAILSGGKMANCAFWFDEKKGKWVSSSYYIDSLPVWVENFNAKNFVNIYLNRTWQTTFPVEKYRESLSDAAAYETGIAGQHTFPYDLSVLSQKYSDASLIKYTPYANTFTKDFAINLMMNEYLGRDAYTDVLLISFSATSYIADVFGLQSVELEDAYIKLDKDIAHLIAAIEDYVGKDNVIFYLTSDRGACENQAWLKDINIQSGTFNPKRTAVVLTSYLRAIYGMGNWVEGFHNNELYLSHFEIDKKKQSLEEIQHKSADLIVSINGISTVICTSDLQKGSYNTGIMQQAQNSYYQGRSGDLFVVLKYGWRLNDLNSLSACSSCYNENTHIPVIFYGKNIPHKTVYKRISMDDIATTLCFLLDIPLPSKATGRPLEEILKH